MAHQSIATLWPRRSLESDVLQCEAAAYALIFSCVSEIHRLMSSKGAEVGDDGALAAADTIDEDGTTYVIVKQEYRGHVRASRIRRLGPAEMYEIAAQEVFPFLKWIVSVQYSYNLNSYSELGLQTNLQMTNLKPTNDL